MLQWPPILAKVQPYQRVQVTKRWDFGTSEIRIILLHEFKICRSAAETNRNIISAWGKRPFQNVIRADGSKNVATAIPALEMGRGRPSVVDDDHLKSIIEADTNIAT
ncbi:SETMAR [Cordylochernes scorpioides]|uniref:SETMAR n=1 Tax=Cordylochernes scorpioides TaxID=51811 RepID=A0ABY6LJI9_9ARAC|nr:SETMAR [Cordylochernes scorpioides]